MINEKSYNGELMQKGKENEEIIFSWLKKYSKSILDFREFRLSQRIDVDFGIETIDGKMVLAEIKSDKWIKDDGNMLFEIFRINHFVNNHWFYLGWGWRSPAQKLIIRNPSIGNIYVFDFFSLRKFIGKYISEIGKELEIKIIQTDKQKTTFVILIPMKMIPSNIFKKYNI